MHSFRIRGRPPPVGRRSTLGSDRPSLDDGFLYGYSYFSQTRDPSIKRGYAQVSACTIWRYTTLTTNPKSVVDRHYLPTSLRCSISGCTIEDRPVISSARRSYTRSSVPQYGKLVRIVHQALSIHLTDPQAQAASCCRRNA